MDKWRRMMILWLLLAAASGPVFSAEWTARTNKQLDALVTSCVVVPCSFKLSGGNLHSKRLSGSWHLLSDREKLVYHEDKTMIMEYFRDRTQMLGRLGEGNCTLQITEVKEHDKDPFCFRIESSEKENDGFSFMENCVQLRILSNPLKPRLHHPQTAIQGDSYTVICSVIHTCPTHVPTLKWNRGPKDSTTDLPNDYKEKGDGSWEVLSVVTFTPEEKDDHTEINCTATFNGGMSSSAVHPLFVKRKENYNHVIIPTAVGIGTAMIFGAICILMMKKYKRHIAELQSRDGSTWNRLSRLSRRILSGAQGPFHSEQRLSNVNTTSFGEQKVSKPRFPSPKSQPRSNKNKEDHDDDDDYINTMDLNIYGNL
ncbi:hypothetical protein LDENG_00160100 [Lucifuga dentata]|nr:hypothetical protein LDENG_00160100 [Lucifuga dentata]